MSLINKYPRLCDLRKPASRRIPKFVFSYLDSGTGNDLSKRENRLFLDKVKLVPRYMRGRVIPDLETKIGKLRFKAPFGVAPVGLSSLIWPGAESILGRAARRHGFPYVLSTVASESIEMLAESAGEMAWFQLYPPRDRDLMQDLLSRAKSCGVKNLVVTADVPAPSRREKMRIAGAPLGSRGNSNFSPKILWQSMLSPEWAIRTLINGGLRFRNMESYAKNDGKMGITTFIGNQLSGSLDWKYLEEIRNCWNDNLYLKGVLHCDDVKRAKNVGVEGIVLSNHGGRQLDATPPPLSQLSYIRAEVGLDFPIIVDSGFMSGLDIVKALSLGADFVFIGRGFLYAVAALGNRGGEHAAKILFEELRDVMAQMGLQNTQEIKRLKAKTPTF